MSQLFRQANACNFTCFCSPQPIRPDRMVSPSCGGGGTPPPFYTGVNYGVGSGPGHQNTVWISNCSWKGPIVCRSWGDFYLQLYQPQAFTVSSSLNGNTCSGCWSIQLNTQPVDAQSSPVPTYQFLIVIQGYYAISGFVEMVLPTSSTCPEGWVAVSGNFLYCGMPTAGYSSPTSLASANLCFVIKPAVDSNGYVQSVFFSAGTQNPNGACQPTAVWSGATITIPSGYSFRYTVGQVNIVGDGSQYQTGSFTFPAPVENGTINLISQDINYGLNFYDLSQSGHPSVVMSGSTVENSNINYFGGFCPCAYSSSQGWN